MVNPTILDNENSFNDNNLQRLFNQKLDLEEILKNSEKRYKNFVKNFKRNLY